MFMKLAVMSKVMFICCEKMHLNIPELNGKIIKFCF